MTIKIFNVRGELVQTLTDEIVEAGAGLATWDGTDTQGASVASGVYFYLTETMGKSSIQKIALIR